MGSRKEEIVMAAMELAAEHGLSNVSMSMIADRDKKAVPLQTFCIEGGTHRRHVSASQGEGEGVILCKDKRLQFDVCRQDCTGDTAADGGQLHQNESSGSDDGLLQDNLF